MDNNANISEKISQFFAKKSFSSSGCKNPLHPGSSAITTKGSITTNTSGIMYQGESFGVPQHNANTNAMAQNWTVITIVFSGLGV